jgi:hypothetical protein
MAVQLSDKVVMAASVYLKKRTRFGETSTITVAHTLKATLHTFDYPYPKAVSVSAEDQGMDPMIC